MKEKFFNIFATGFVFALAFANFYAAYEIKMGKEMKLVELRPSYSQRFREAYNIMYHTPSNLQGMSDEERNKYFDEQLQAEEEKELVRSQIL